MFKSKVIIVTGSSTGIGAGTAIKFAQEGAKGVVLHGRNEKSLMEVKEKCEQAGKGCTKVHICIGDITDENVRKNLINSTVDQFGQLDVLVNNAGVAPMAPFQDTTLEQFDLIFNVNVKALMSLIQLATPHLAKTKGNIVNISSAVALKALSFGEIYACSKAAVDFLTKCLSLSLGPQGIRINSVNPAYVPGTDIINRHQEFDEKKMIEHAANTYPLRRAGTIEETADAIIFLASENAKFITGTVLAVDGGFVRS